MAKRTETAVEEFTDDLSRLLAHAQKRAHGWLGQRTNISKQLSNIRDTASQLLRQLGGDGEALNDSVRPARRGRPVGRSTTVTPAPAKKRRTISAAGRARIAAAQKARWAKVKAGEKKK